MFPSIMVRSEATLDFMMMQAENPRRRADSGDCSRDRRKNCENGSVWQEGIGGWLSAGCSPQAGLSMHLKWVGE
ncbi:MAG TPA: hypothetical protein DCQ94_18915 [Nitrospira sp.]|jgi:hypothetical protein|nr:hypothetical protein [Nitrospira sp.]